MEEKVSDDNLSNCPDCNTPICFSRPSPPDNGVINQECWCDNCEFTGRIAYTTNTDGGTWRYLPEDEW